MEQNLAAAFFDFKGRGSHNQLWRAEQLMISFSNSALDTDYQLQKSLSHELLRARLEFVENSANGFFESHDTKKMNPTPLSNGGESLVFDCDNGYVLKIRKGEPYPRIKSNLVLQPAETKYSQTLNVTYDIFPKVETKPISRWDAQKMRIKSLMHGFRLADANPYNFGTVCNKGKEKLVVIDAGAVLPIKKPIDLYYIGRDFMMPVYEMVPFIHEPWREFRDTLKDMLGMPQRKHKPATHMKKITG